jgi:hypothetical protein
MHRSGTSVLGGLMSKMGLQTGGPLIGPASDNKKGFFERIDVVLQNDELMKRQRVWYSHRTHAYDAQQGLKDIMTDDPSKSRFFREGERGLAFLNDPKNYPWMLKDPRLCITIRTWLPLLKFVPAVVFAYRHPYDVASSMNKRETEHFMIGKGLKLWYVYNRRAIQQSNDLCRVTSSHRLMMKDPETQLRKIYEGLRECGVDVPHEVSTPDIKSFIDVNLQHGKATQKDTSCEGDISQILLPDTWQSTDVQNHLKLYRECMRLYCALEDGSAFSIDKKFKFDMSIKDE